MRSDSLKALTVNENAKVAILSEIRRMPSNGISQPILIIGEDGAGKTTLLNRISKETCEKSNVSIDGRTIFNTDQIIKIWEDAGAPRLLLIDDWDYYLSRTDYDDQYRLRKWLYSEDAPMMIAAVSRLYPALADYKAPFFEGLDFIYLDPISDDTLKIVFRKKDLERALLLWDILPKTIKSIVDISEIVTINDNQGRDLQTCISRYSPQFRKLYQDLPVYSQMILNALEGRMLLSEIHEKTSLPTSVLPSYLASLKKHGIIKVDKSEKRKTKYFIRNPLFGLWLKMPSM